MRITRIRDEPVDDGMRELSATLRFGPREAERKRVFLRRPDPGTPPPNEGDPLFVAHLVSAMALGEDLVVEGPVSSDLVSNATDTLVPRLLGWHTRLTEPEIRVELAAPPESSADAGTGALFSGGIDSWYSLARRRAELTHLVHIHGFEVHVDDTEVWRRAHDAVRGIAEEEGLRALPVVTNLKLGLQAVRSPLRRQGRPWRDIFIEAWYGSMLTAAGLSLRPALRKLVIPSSWSVDIKVAIGSNPELEPAWTTPSMEIRTDGDNVSRLDKVRWLGASAPEAFRSLRVCVENAERAGGYLNCGRCIKCVRTLIEMRIAGLSMATGLFRHPLDLSFAMLQRFPGDPHYWYALAAEAEKAGDTELRDAVRVILDEKWHPPRLLADLRRALRGRRGLRDLRLPRQRQH